MATSPFDQLRPLIAPDDLYDPETPDLVVAPLATVGAARPRRRRAFGGDVTAVLLGLCIASWSVVAVETWMLVR